ncbi:MAG TPA: cyclase family protein [Solirubrobacteraceae bacterium]|jgi:kynurenine formamidase|nr:cyclase family protein [Solirubrobacteraceae bacterium]
MTQIVDLSHVIKPDPPDLPDFLRSEVTYNPHSVGAGEFEQLLQIDRAMLLREEGPASERLSIGTHSVTHLDAPYHYNSTIQGKPSETIDELPLEWFFAPGVVVDATGRDDGDAVTLEQMQAGIDAAGHALQPLDIVLVHTGTDRHYGARDYMHHGPGVSPEATVWLWEQGVRVMGIDAWGWDAPLQIQADAARESKAMGVVWAAHQVDLPYSQIERLTNLGALPRTGFTVACFPLKIQRASAAPARVVAIID